MSGQNVPAESMAAGQQWASVEHMEAEQSSHQAGQHTSPSFPSCFLPMRSGVPNGLPMQISDKDVLVAAHVGTSKFSAIRLRDAIYV